MSIIQIVGIVVLIIGILLIGVEFYMPGFGLPGISGTIFTVIGIFLAGGNTSGRILVGIIAIVLIAAMLVISILLFNSQKIKSPIKLDTDLPGKNVFIDEEDMEFLVGRTGSALTDLRPSGKGEFEGVKLDIVSSNNYIKKGSALVISEIRNHRIIVEEVQS